MKLLFGIAWKKGEWIIHAGIERFEKQFIKLQANELLRCWIQSLSLPSPCYGNYIESLHVPKMLGLTELFHNASQLRRCLAMAAIHTPLMAAYQLSNTQGCMFRRSMIHVSGTCESKIYGKLVSLQTYVYRTSCTTLKLDSRQQQPSDVAVFSMAVQP